MPDSRGVRIPAELESAPARPLEDYVRARLVQFAGAFAARAAPGLGPADVRAAAAAAIAGLPPPERGGGPAARELQLVFRHDCLSLGCLDPQCALCEHNPARRCAVNFAPKYLVGDVLRAKCDAPIRVEAIDRATGLPVGADLPGVHLEVCILDGNAYDARCLEAGAERGADLAACGLLANHKGGPLLGAGPGGTHAPDGRVILQLVRGSAALPDLHVTDSSEAMLSGRKPPFRLLVRAVRSDGSSADGNPPARHAVSEGFVVATRRTRTAGKVEIPSVDDHVSKLEHMGKETVKKLQDVAGSAAAAGTPIPAGVLPDNSIDKVGQFRRLALIAEADGHLRQKLQAVLKLSKEKWDDARDHALRAVVADGRMRIWHAGGGGSDGTGAPASASTPDVGLLFTCRLGHVDLERPAGLLTRVEKEGGGGGPTYEATLMAQQTPAQRDLVRSLAPRAAAAWWAPGHPGWAIYPADSDAFLATGALGGGSGMAPSSSRPGSGGGGARAPTRAAAAAAQAAAAAAAAAAAPPQPLPFIPRAPAAAPPTSMPPPPPPPPLSAGVSPFAAAVAAGRAPPGAPPPPLDTPGAYAPGGALSGVFSGALAGDIARMYSAGLAMAPFPSVHSGGPGTGGPGTGPSGLRSDLLSSADLDALLPVPGPSGRPSLGVAPGPGSGRAISLGLGKLDSLEMLPEDAVGPREGPRGDPRGAGAPLTARANSGLETMQSIEQALGSVQQTMDRVVSEWGGGEDGAGGA